MHNQTMRGEESPIPNAAYVERVGTPPGIQMHPTALIAERLASRGLRQGAPSRLGFHLLLGVRADTLECAVDFVDYTISIGEWLWIRPRQVHQYRCDLAGTTGTAILFANGFISPATAGLVRLDDPLRQPLWSPSSGTNRSVETLVDALRAEYAAVSGERITAHVATLRHILSALLLTISATGAVSDQPSNRVFDAFCKAVEARFTQTRKVADYADLLGFSTRTLTRAAIAATGHGPKNYIDDRVLLEAKRLLAHTDSSSGAVARLLGFSTPSDFSRFFQLRTGTTPAQFRSIT